MIVERKETESREVFGARNEVEKKTCMEIYKEEKS